MKRSKARGRRSEVGGRRSELPFVLVNVAMTADGKISTASETIVKQEITVDRDAVARLAYSYWEARGFVGGSPEEDWLRAERELRENHAASATA